ADHRAMGNDGAVDEKLVKLVLAPAALKRSRMQRGDGGGIAVPGLRNFRLGPTQEARNEVHHRRGSCGAFCGCASGARRYCGFGGDLPSGTTAPMRATQAISGAGRASTAAGLGSRSDRPTATDCAAEPTMQERAAAAARTASASGESRGA